MVRAPPCHGGSCGFEPRLPRIFIALSWLVILSTFFSCSDQSLSYFRYEGEALTKQLIGELRQIRTRDDLVEHSLRLQELFNSLVDVIIRAQEFKDKHPEEQSDALSIHKEATESDQLRIELNRVLHMEGGREVIEKAQEAALNRLDALEKIRLPK